MKELIMELKESRVTKRKAFKIFSELGKLVESHMVAEESALLERIMTNPKLEEEAVEGLEEHEIQRAVMRSISRVKDADQRFVRMKSFCEILEHHLLEEEEELFPKVKKYMAKSTRRKIGRHFLKARKKSGAKNAPIGALE